MPRKAKDRKRNKRLLNAKLSREGRTANQVKKRREKEKIKKNMGITPKHTRGNHERTMSNVREGRGSILRPDKQKGTPE